MKVRTAVRTEVTTYTKYVIGTLKLCQQIANGISIPMSEAEYVGRALIPPIIFPAVADRVALLPYPQATIEFYMRVEEAKANLSAMRMKVQGLTQAQSAFQTIQPAQAETVADSLITALQVARVIVADDDPTRSAFDLAAQKCFVNEIDAALASAQVTFPSAESFRT